MTLSLRSRHSLDSRPLDTPAARPNLRLQSRSVEVENIGDSTTQNPLSPLSCTAFLYLFS